MVVRMHLGFIFPLFLPFSLGFYTSEPPVKLLTVGSVASRFPAANVTEMQEEDGYVSPYYHSVILKTS